MENLSYDPQIQHFSHPHTLQLSNLQDNPQLRQPTSLSVCSACQHPLSSGGAWIYSCPPCRFAVHACCAQLPRLIAHPSHPVHHLSLLPSPAYPSGSFVCNACGRRASSGFCYHCAECHYDLQVACACASKPLEVTHRLHPHALHLAFYPPYAARGFLCRVCGGAGGYHWLYRCGLCEFDAHLDCATGAIAQPSPPQPPSQLQHYNSFPGANNSHWHQYPNQTAPAILRPTTLPGLPNHIMHSYSMGAVPNSQPLPPPPRPAAAGGINSLMGSAIQIAFNCTANLAAQTLLPEMLSSTSGGNNNGNDGSGYDGGGDSSSTSLMDVGSSILSTMLGGS